MSVPVILWINKPTSLLMNHHYPDTTSLKRQPCSNFIRFWKIFFEDICSSRWCCFRYWFFSGLKVYISRIVFVWGWVNILIWSFDNILMCCQNLYPFCIKLMLMIFFFLQKKTLVNTSVGRIEWKRNIDRESKRGSEWNEIGILHGWMDFHWSVLIKVVWKC